MVSTERFPKRAEGARATRRSIVRAASELFVTRGYQATSIAQVAAEAGVGVQTVYASFGTKRAILSAAVDQAIVGDDRPVVVNDRDWMRVVLEADDPEVRLRAYARAVRRILDGAALMFEVLQVAASGDPELAAAWAEAGRRRRVGVSGVVQRIGDEGRLRDGLSVDAAIDVVWSMNGHELYLHLVRDCGWTGDRYAEWLGETFVELLLKPRA